LTTHFFHIHYFAVLNLIRKDCLDLDTFASDLFYRAPRSKA
ncbi:Uncharacterized protein APZ42_010663, partial [Daphnia magna]